MLVLPTSASALDAATEQRIAYLRQQIAMLQNQLILLLQAEGTSGTGGSNLNSTCVNLLSDFTLLSTDTLTNGEVTKLQNFLRGRPEALWPSTVPSSGYFGSVTQKALSNFQLHHAIYISTFAKELGSMDQATRTFIKNLTCADAGSNTTDPTEVQTPRIELAVSKNMGVAPLTVTLSATLKNLSSCAGVVWNFGDGATSQTTLACPPTGGTIVGSRTLNVNHTYQNAGTFVPSVTSGSYFDSETIRVSAVAETANAPVISFMIPSYGPVGTSVTLYGSGFTPTGNKIKFGNLGSEYNPAYNLSSDGSSLTFNVPAVRYFECFNSSPACQVATTATTPGYYDVSVINSNGTSNARAFTVSQAVTNNTPMTSLVASPQTGSAPLLVNFIATATNAPSCTDMNWEFGDGNSASLTPTCLAGSENILMDRTLTMQHTYAQAGTYNADFGLGNLNFSPVTITVSGATQLSLGDIDADGRIGLFDMAVLQNHVSGFLPLTGEALLRANLDTNNVVNDVDLILLRKVILGTINSSDLPIRWGDINVDGSVDVTDSVLSNRLASNLSVEITAKGRVAADVDMNGQFSIADTKLINGAILNLVTLPAVFGDLDGDNSASLTDLVMLSRIVDNQIQATTQQKFTGDVHHNGSLNADDISTLRQFIIGTVALLPVIPVQ